jgi:hypothetical protein
MMRSTGPKEMWTVRMQLSRRLVLPCAALGVVLLTGFAFARADRPAIVVTPQGSPLVLDSQKSLLFDTPAVWVAWRNDFGQPINYALKIWVFDERSRLKGTLDYCGHDKLSSHSRGHTLVALEIPGVTLRDRAVVTVMSAASDKVEWKLRETEDKLLGLARAASRGSAGRLSLKREDKASTNWTCPCECAAIQNLCDLSCGMTGRAVSSCTRTSDSGCSASCACK